MAETAPPVRKRQPLMNARQIAVTAIFGGLTFVATAMGISLPGYLPMVNFELIGTFATVGTMAAGPWAGVIITFLNSLASPVGLYGWPCYWPHIFLLAWLYPRVYRIESKPVKLVAFWLLSSFALFVQYWAWFVLYAYVFAIMPLWALVVYNFGGGPYVVYMFIWTLIPAILLMTTPDFVKPEWVWWPKPIEEED